MIRKASSKLWMLREMKNLQLDPKYLIDFYKKEIRSTLEYAAPVWNAGLTQKLSRDVERVQRSALAIITASSPHTSSYTSMCRSMSMDTLAKRRQDISLKFARKTVSNSRHSDLFQLNPSTHHTRHLLPYYQPIIHTTRFQRSPLIHLTKLLNNHP